MQLLIIALMLMMSGKNANINEIKPIIESFGGGEAAEAFKRAEELSGVISAVQSFTAAASQQHNANGAFNADSAPFSGETAPCESAAEGYPLAPVAAIADEKITYCLSRYIALGE